MRSPRPDNGSGRLESAGAARAPRRASAASFAGVAAGRGSAPARPRVGPAAAEPALGMDARAARFRCLVDPAAAVSAPVLGVDARAARFRCLVGPAAAVSAPALGVDARATRFRCLV